VGHFRSQITLLVILGLAACVPIVIRPGAGGPTRAWPASADCPVPARSASDVPQLVALMNAERSRVGLQPLTLSAPISAVAHAYACEAAARQDIGHVGSDGSQVAERLRRGGITAAMVAENNASFYRTPEEAMAAWMASPQHRANILRPNARKVGAGQADGVQAVWVVNFAS
jgi:uncharacterized protein YkwD